MMSDREQLTSEQPHWFVGMAKAVLVVMSAEIASFMSGDKPQRGWMEGPNVYLGGLTTLADKGHHRPALPL